VPGTPFEHLILAALAGEPAPGPAGIFGKQDGVRGAVRYVCKARGGRVHTRGQGGCRDMGQGASVVSYRIHPAALRQSRIHPQSGRVVPAGAYGPEELKRPEQHVPVLLRRRGALKDLELARDDGLVLHSVQRKVPAVEVVKLLLLDGGEKERRPPVG